MHLSGQNMIHHDLDMTEIIIDHNLLVIAT
jgi:hypothetical protein